MKICSKCGETKDIGCFVKQAKAADGLFPWCADCRQKYRKETRESNLEGVRQYTNDKRTSRIRWFQELKSNIPCVDCSQIYEPYCMDYDHVPGRGEKIKSVSRMVLDNTPKEVILAEIGKCDLICTLCHNKRTYSRFNEVLENVRKYRSHEQRNIDIINEFKAHPCVICGKQYEHYNMQIDHIDPAIKLYDVCQLKSRKVEILFFELVKCQVLCALCHRRKSIIEQQDEKYNVDRPKPPKRQELFYDTITNIKECGRCHQIKDGSLFRPNKNMICGLDTYCKECFNGYRREKRKRTKNISKSFGVSWNTST